MFPSRISFVIGAAAVLAAGCSAPDDGGPGWTVRDSAGIRIIENAHARPVWRDGEAWRLSERPVLALGAVDTDGPDQFYRVTHGQRRPDGTLYVVNSGTAEVRIFDAGGRHVRTVGRRGDGPSEFRSPWNAYPLGTDSLLVIDLYRAVSVFDTAGNHSRRFVPGDIAGELQGAPIGRFTDGTLLFMRYKRQDPAWTGLRRSRVEMVRVALDGAITSFGDYDEQTGLYGSSTPYLFGPWARMAAADTTWWYGPGDRLELREIGFDGTVRRLVRLDAPPVPVTAPDVKAHVDAILARSEGQPYAADMARRYADVQHPEHFPAHMDILVDGAGHLWVQEYRPFTERSRRRWYVFDPDGRHLGSLVMPEGLSVYQITADAVIGKWTDDLGVEYVHVYSIEGR